MGLSRRKYATRRGVSEKAVRKAIAAGRITVEADGTIDPVKADKQWAAQTDPAMQRGQSARTATKPVPKSALRAVDDTLRDAGALPEADGEVSFMRARMANEVLKAQTAKVRLQKMKGELVDRASATTMVFDLARRERDAWLNWPSRVAANMAAELGVDTHLTEQVLDKYLRRHLADMAEIEIALR
ncbi:MAG: elements of external origin [Marinosulfonomonas sp.]|nr:elements of external origin [Marinosulfonomonas sp.]